MNTISHRKAVLKEILGKNKPGEDCSLFLGLDDPKLGPLIARCYKNDWPTWHLKYLIGEELKYEFVEGKYCQIIKFDKQTMGLKAKLIESLFNKGSSTLKKYRIFDETVLLQENNKYIKEFIKRIKIESILNLEICNEIS